MLIRIRGVKTVTAKGREYHYHRATGLRITSAPQTAAFVAEVARLDQIAAEKAESAATARAGTLGALIGAYRASPEFSALAVRTRQDYNRVMDHLQPLREMPISQISSGFVLKLRDKTALKHKRRFANYVVQVLRLLFAWGRPREYMSDNPAAGVPLLRRPKGTPRANRPWHAGELKMVLDQASPTVLVAVALGAYAALREGDALRITWGGYDGQTIKIIQGKTADSLHIPAHPKLRAILNQAKSALVSGGQDDDTIVLGARGAPLTESGFRAIFFRFLRKLEGQGLIGHGLTYHGLRHTVGDALADAGCSRAEIAAILGHRTEAMASHYSAGADRLRQAASAMDRLQAADKRSKTQGDE